MGDLGPEQVLRWPGRCIGGVGLPCVTRRRALPSGERRSGHRLIAGASGARSVSEIASDGHAERQTPQP